MTTYKQPTPQALLLMTVLTHTFTQPFFYKFSTNKNFKFSNHTSTLDTDVETVL